MDLVSGQLELSLVLHCHLYIEWLNLDYVNEISIHESPFKTINNGNASSIADLFNVLYTDEEFKNMYNIRIREIYKDPRFSIESFSAILNRNMELA